MTPITTTAELAEACARMAKHPFVTVDTEFLRETTYYPILCVAQMATTDEAVVIDALAKGIDLSPFFDLMANEGVMKVFHAARQDIEIAWNLAKKIPHPIFDSQVAAMVLGYGDFDLLRPAGAAHHRRHAGQIEPLHRLDPAPIDRGTTHLCGVGRHAFARRLFEAVERPDRAGTQRLGARGNGSAHRSRYLQNGAGTGLGTPQKPCPQAEGSGDPHRACGLAGARGTDSRRSPRARAQGRRDRRHRDSGPDQHRTARAAAFAAEGLRALEMGRGDRRCDQARPRARSEAIAAHRAFQGRRQRRGHGRAT